MNFVKAENQGGAIKILSNLNIIFSENLIINRTESLDSGMLAKVGPENTLVFINTTL